MSRKMKEKLSRAFETYDVCKLNNVEHMQAVEEPVIQLAKAQFQKSYRNKNKFRDLLLCQLKFCGIKMWTFELLIAIITSLILRNLLADPYFMTTRKLVFFVVCFAIAVPMMLLPFLYRSIRYQMFEMESVSGLFHKNSFVFQIFAVFRRRGAACRIRFVGFMEHNIHYICRVGRLYSDSVFTCQRWLPVVVEKNKIRKAVSEFSGIWNCINRNHSNKFSFNRTDVMDADDTGNRCVHSGACAVRSVSEYDAF